MKQVLMTYQKTLACGNVHVSFYNTLMAYVPSPISQKKKIYLKKRQYCYIVVNCVDSFSFTCFLLFFDNVGNFSKEEPLDSPLPSKTYEQPMSPTRTSCQVIQASIQPCLLIIFMLVWIFRYSFSRCDAYEKNFEAQREYMGKKEYQVPTSVSESVFFFNIHLTNSVFFSQFWHFRKTDQINLSCIFLIKFKA